MAVTADSLTKNIFWKLSKASSPAKFTIPFENRAPSTNNTSPQEPSTIYNIAPEGEIPDGWERDYFLVDNIPIYYYIMRAEKERGLMVGSSGLKSEQPLNADKIKHFNNNGISVIMMALPNMGRSLNFMRFLEKSFNEFIQNPNSPAHTLFDKGLPRFLYSHSTSGQFVVKEMLKASDKHPLYKEVFAEAPFLDVAQASLEDAWIPRTAFNAYARLNKDKLPSETFWGLNYLNYHHYKGTLKSTLPDAGLLKNISPQAAFTLSVLVKTFKDLYLPAQQNEEQPWFKKEGDEFTTPTYGQILEIQKHGQADFLEIKKGQSKLSTPLTIIQAHNDPFSCPKTNMKLGDSVEGITYIESEHGGHNPTNRTDNVSQTMINKMSPYLLKEPIESAEQKNLSSTAKKWSITLGDHLSSFGNAYKILTRGFNPGAGFA